MTVRISLMSCQHFLRSVNSKSTTLICFRFPHIFLHLPDLVLTHRFPVYQTSDFARIPVRSISSTFSVSHSPPATLYLLLFSLLHSVYSLHSTCWESNVRKCFSLPLGHRSAIWTQSHSVITLTPPPSRELPSSSRRNDSDQPLCSIYKRYKEVTIWLNEVSFLLLLRLWFDSLGSKYSRGYSSCWGACPTASSISTKTPHDQYSIGLFCFPSIFILSPYVHHSRSQRLIWKESLWSLDANTYERWSNILSRHIQMFCPSPSRSLSCRYLCHAVWLRLDSTHSSFARFPEGSPRETQRSRPDLWD